MKTAIVNLGVILTGDWREPFAAGEELDNLRADMMQRQNELRGT